MKSISINATSNVPAYKQIYQGIKSAISSGEFSANDRLPPVRTLSKQLSVSHLTVHRAYQELADEHLVSLRHGSGVYVAPLQQMEVARAHLEKFLTAGALMDFEETAHRSNVDSLATLTPDVRLFDASQIFATMLSAVKQDPWQLGFHTEGSLPALKTSLVAWMSQYGVTTHPDQVIVRANGNSIGSLAKAILPKDSTLLLEQPTYLMAEDWLPRFGVTPIGIPRTKTGVDLDFLTLAAKNASISGVLVSPNFGFGTGESWSKETRDAFLEIVRRARWTVIESYSRAPLAYGQPMPPLAADAPDLQIFTDFSMSEMLAPGLNFSWVVLPNTVDESTRKALRTQTVVPLRPLQVAMSKFIESNEFEECIRQCATNYARRFQIFSKALLPSIPQQYRLSQVQGGFSAVLYSPDSFDPANLFQTTLENNVPVMPGGFLGVGGACRNLVRLNFGSLDESRLTLAGRQLGRLLPSTHQSSKIS